MWRRTHDARRGTAGGSGSSERSYSSRGDGSPSQWEGQSARAPNGESSRHDYSRNIPDYGDAQYNSSRNLDNGRPVTRGGSLTASIPRSTYPEKRGGSAQSNTNGGNSTTPSYQPPRRYSPSVPTSPTYPSSPPRWTPRSPHQKSSEYARKSRKGEFIPHLPPDDYIKLSSEPVVPSSQPTPKLLVLDLNGALVYRSKGTGPNRRSYPRPFLHNFLAYLMAAEPNGAPSPWDVLVWSSAQPHNVRAMVETTFGPWCDGQWNKRPALPEGEKRLLDVWARDKMNLSVGDYSNNVQTTKDLRDVIREIGRFNERSVVLLDDSPFKAIFQPWSQIVIPEFDTKEYTSSILAAQLFEATGKSEEIDITAEDGMDATLLAVIGVLEAMRNIPNIPAWIRSGGIQYPEVPAAQLEDVTLDTLPSAAEFQHWHTDATTHEYWVEAGKNALARKGITLDHGLDTSEARSFSKSPSPQPKSRGDSRQSSPPAWRGQTRGMHSLTSAMDDILYPRNDKGWYSPTDWLRDIANGSAVSDEQRTTLSRALSILKDLGFGSTPPTEDPLVDDPQASQDPSAQPVDPRSITDQIVLPTVYRPRAALLKGLKSMTSDRLDQLHSDIAMFERRLRATPAAPKAAAWRALLSAKVDLRDLIIVPPGPPLVDLIKRYRDLPVDPNPPDNPPEAFKGKKPKQAKRAKRPAPRSSKPRKQTLKRERPSQDTHEYSTRSKRSRQASTSAIPASAFNQEHDQKPIIIP